MNEEENDKITSVKVLKIVNWGLLISSILFLVIYFLTSKETMFGLVAVVTFLYWSFSQITYIIIGTKHAFKN